MTQHLPPATVSICLQGGSGANGHVTTHHQPHEQLLMGWMLGGTMTTWGQQEQHNTHPTKIASN